MDKRKDVSKLNFSKNRYFYMFISFLFISGFCAISYEIIWLRSLRLILGSDSIAIAAVLASFMAGLGIGSLFFGKLSDSKSPLKIYRWLEFAIGILGIFSIKMFPLVNDIYKYIFINYENSPNVVFPLKFLLALIILGLPVFFMGGTLPVTVCFLTENFKLRSERISIVYGINTLGACVSAAIVPFLLLPSFKQNKIILFTAGLNLLVFFGTFFLTDNKKSDFSKNKDISVDKKKREKSFLPIVLFITGFVSISLETVWNRLFSLNFTNSVYSFSLILIVYLAGISIGSLIFSKIKTDISNIINIFAITQILIGIFILFQVIFIDKTSMISLWFFSFLNLNFSNYILIGSIIITIFTFPITFLYGISFPAGLTFLTKNPKFFGSQIGFLSALNTFGTSIASILVTFVFFGILGSRNTLIFLSILCFINFIILFKLTSFKFKILYFIFYILLILIAFAIKWDLKNFHLLLCQKPDWTLQMFKQNKLENYKKNLEIIDFLEDREAIVSVGEFSNRDKILYINGKPDASNSPNDLLAQYLCGYLPFLYIDNSNSAKVLILGLGSGSTTFAASLQEPKSLMTLEIVPLVEKMAKNYFPDINNSVTNKTKITFEDGRNYIQNTDEKFDIIISEPSNPWISSISNLFTEEFFLSIKKHLKKDGIFCQWFYYYKMDFDYIIGIISTLRSVFPYINAFNLTGDIILVASISPLKLNTVNLLKPDEKIISLLKKIGINSPEETLNYFLWNSEQIKSLESKIPINEDNKNWLEFEAPKYIFMDYSKSNLRKLLEYFSFSSLPIDLNYTAKNNQYIFPELGINLENLYKLEVSFYGIVKENYTNDVLLDNAFWRAELKDNNNGKIKISSPIINGFLNLQITKIVLLKEVMYWEKYQPVTVTTPEHTYLSFVKDEKPFCWTGVWNCNISQKSYILTVEKMSSVTSRDELLALLKNIKCH